MAAIHHRSIDGDDLLKCRESAGMTQTELAKKCGLSQGYISELETPGIRDIRKMVADKIEQVFSSFTS